MRAFVEIGSASETSVKTAEGMRWSFGVPSPLKGDMLRAP
jgi:hypothetical protein